MALNSQIEQINPQTRNNSANGSSRRAKKPAPQTGIGLTFDAITDPSPQLHRRGEIGTFAAEPESPATQPTNWLSPELQNQLGPDSLLYQSWQDHSNRTPPARRSQAKPEALRKYPKLGEARDAAGILWDVRSIRPTKHGFDLLYGTASPARPNCGPPRLLATKELLEFWDHNRTRLNMVYDLPAGRSTLKRLRQRFEFHVKNDTTAFYTARIQDLETLTAPEFAAKHGVAVPVASDRRRRIFGNSGRPRGWWRRPMFLKFLLSDMTLINVGRKLGIGTSHAMRLRRQAERDLQRLPLAA